MNLASLRRRIKALESTRRVECRCPPPPPAEPIPGTKLVHQGTLDLGLMPCAKCGGWFHLVIEQRVIVPATEASECDALGANAPSPLPSAAAPALLTRYPCAEAGTGEGYTAISPPDAIDG
jgi:hypothetical protein